MKKAFETLQNFERDTLIEFCRRQGISRPDLAGMSAEEIARFICATIPEAAERAAASLYRLELDLALDQMKSEAKAVATKALDERLSSTEQVIHKVSVASVEQAKAAEKSVDFVKHLQTVFLLITGGLAAFGVWNAKEVNEQRRVAEITVNSVREATNKYSNLSSQLSERIAESDSLVKTQTINLQITAHGSRVLEILRLVERSRELAESLSLRINSAEQAEIERRISDDTAILAALKQSFYGNSVTNSELLADLRMHNGLAAFYQGLSAVTNLLPLPFGSSNAPAASEKIFSTWQSVFVANEGLPSYYAIPARRLEAYRQNILAIAHIHLYQSHLGAPRDLAAATKCITNAIQNDPHFSRPYNSLGAAKLFLYRSERDKPSPDAGVLNRLGIEAQEALAEAERLAHNPKTRAIILNNLTVVSYWLADFDAGNTNNGAREAASRHLKKANEWLHKAKRIDDSDPNLFETEAELMAVEIKLESVTGITPQIRRLDDVIALLVKAKERGKQSSVNHLLTKTPLRNLHVFGTNITNMVELALGQTK